MLNLIQLSIELNWYDDQTIEPYPRIKRTKGTYEIIKILMLEKSFKLQETDPRFCEKFY